jgi:prophage DNA circulation protein
MTEMKTYCMKPQSAMGVYQSLMEFKNTCTVSQHPQSSSNQLAFSDLIQNSALLQALSVAANAPFNSWDEALIIRNDLVSKLDRVIETTQDIHLSSQFSSLRSLLILLIPKRHDLPRLKVYTMPSTQSALVLAYILYNDATWADQIVKQNTIAHPGFIPAGKTLRVLV